MHRGAIIAAAAVGLLGAVTLVWTMGPAPAAALPALGETPRASPAPTQAGPGAAHDPSADDGRPNDAPSPNAGEPRGDEVEGQPGGVRRPTKGRRTMPPRPWSTPDEGDVGAAGQDAGSHDADQSGDFQDRDAEEQAQWLEDRMVDFLDAVVPETSGEALERSCTDSGRMCTFEGPTTDDSFMRRWLEAQANGNIDLQGVTFSELHFEDRGDRRYFSFTARAP